MFGIHSILIDVRYICIFYLGNKMELSVYKLQYNISAICI